MVRVAVAEEGVLFLHHFCHVLMSVFGVEMILSVKRVLQIS